MEEPAADDTSSNFPLVIPAAGQQRPAAGDLWHLHLRRGPAAQESGAHSHPRNLEHDNVVDVPIPQLKKTAIGPEAPSTIRFHRLGAAQLRGLWNRRRPAFST